MKPKVIWSRAFRKAEVMKDWQKELVPETVQVRMHIKQQLHSEVTICMLLHNLKNLSHSSLHVSYL